ncbi:MAG: S8 family serine peptidase, partial [Verrucomicrobiales bacterium]|nr:S8 family serine peptidase [Verrucomicrobiales bacterium]
MIEKPSFKHPLLRIDEEIAIEADGTRRVISQQAYVADHVVFKPKDGLTETQILERLKPLGAAIRKKMPASGIWLISFPNVTLDTVPRALREIRKMGDLAKVAEVDWVVHAQLVPNDSNFSTLWGMNNTGQSGGVADADIDAPEAWDMTTGSRSVLVGVIDSGIDYNHPDLAANMWMNPGEIAGNGIDDDSNGYIDDVRGWDFANDDNDSMDDNSHGTHCSGTIGGVGDNGNGVAGVNWQVSLVGLKFLDSTGNGLISDATEATAYATDLGVTLTSNSWGGGGYSQSMQDVLEEANAAGILFVAAAGNDGTDVETSPNYPSGYQVPNVIAVAATTDADELASFSNYAATEVDLAAPGQSINSTIPNNSYAYFNGTSMATPHVSGACALLKAWYPALTHSEIKSIILRSVDPVAALTGFCATGGRLNVHQALLQSEEITTVPETPHIATMSFGGAPSPANKTYTLRNRATTSASWTATASEPWVALSLTSGTLVPGESFPLVVSFTSGVQMLQPGVHEAIVTISNITSGRSETRKVSVEVVPPVLIAENLDTDPGWPMDGEWAFGQPTGDGAINHGFPDPTGGATGTNVIGVNLAGDYSITPGGPFYVTAGPFDLTGRDHTQLQFERWLNTDAGDWVGAWVDVSHDGVTWDRLWTNIGGVSDAEWTTQRFDISATADEQATVWVRWAYDVKDIADVWDLSGWNIDDIKILGTQSNRLALNGPQSMTEGDAAQTFTVTVTPAPVDDLIVTISSSAPSQATAPMDVTILAGQTSADFLVTPVDDLLADGTQTVTVSASAIGHEGSTLSTQVHDNEVRTLSITMPANVTEGDGTISGQASISLDSPTDADVWIVLTSDDPGELTVPATILIPSGMSSADFEFTVADDFLIDGTQTVHITASQQGWTTGSTSIDVLDDEARTLTMNLPVSILEGQSTTAQGSVTLAGITPVPLTIALVSNDLGEVTVPSSITCPAGGSSVSFPLTAVDDTEVDGDQTVTITATVATFSNGVSSLIVHDDESPARPGNPQPFNTATQIHPDSDLTWTDLPGTGATPDSYEVYFGTSPSLAAPDLLGSTTDHTWVLPRLTPGTQYFWQIIAHKGSATNASPVWHFDVPPIGPPVRFEWSAIPASVLVSQPINATVTAYDAFDNVSTGYNASADLTVVQPLDTIVISEVNPNTPDAIEFTNVSDAKIDLSGWVISIYDGDVWPGRKTFTLPAGTLCAAGDSFVLEEAGTTPGAYPYFYTGANINWLADPLSAVAVLISKPDGTMIDFVCATYANPVLITSPAVIPPTQWSGPPIAVPLNSANDYSRVGSTDHHTSADWIETTPAIGTLDPAMEIPFWGNEFLTAASPNTIDFSSGVWNGVFNVRQPLTDIRARITATEGQRGHSSAFSVSSVGALSLTVDASSYNEDVGVIADAVSVSIPAPSVEDVTITITSSDTTEIVSMSLFIPAGQTIATSDLTILDDLDLDGTQRVTLDASAIGYEPMISIIDVHDNETTTLTLTVPATANEADGVLAGQGNVSVPVPVDADVQVALLSSDPSEVILPPFTTILAGQSSATFDVTIVQDDLLDGTQPVNLTASVTNWTSGTAITNVTDDEQESATIIAPTSVYEGQGTLPTGLTIQIGGIAVSEIPVALASSDETELIVPTSVTVPIGQSSVTVPLTVVDDAVFDGSQHVTISIEAFGSIQTPASITVQDNDAASFEISPVPSPQKEGVAFSVTITPHDF